LTQMRLMDFDTNEIDGDAYKAYFSKLAPVFLFSLKSASGNDIEYKYCKNCCRRVQVTHDTTMCAVSDS
jgi:hypothetical protein